MVDPAQVFSVSIVVVIKIKIVEANTRSDMNISGKLYLVLNIGSGQSGSHMIVRVRWALVVGYWCADGGIGIRRQDRNGGVIEEAGVAKIVRKLAANLHSTEECVAYSSSRHKISCVRLIEQISALSCVV